MKVISCHLENFASYKELDFSFDDKGLVLIQGATGSGKSTLCDAIPWILFGRTAKNGSVDEILSWPGDKTTYGCLELDKSINVYRIRGKGKNDLYYSTAPMQIVRGKDLQDTQKLINNLLGLNIDLYLSGAYFHEFSQTAQFFTTTAKSRRAICEQIVDLSLAKDLQEKTNINLKQANKDLDQANSKITQLEANIALLTRMQANETSKFDIWAKTQVAKINHIESNVLKFEEARDMRVKRAKVTAKAVNCSECGQVKPTAHVHKDNSNEILDEVNPYLNQLEQARSEVNPHTGGVKDFTNDIAFHISDIALHNRSKDIHQTQAHDLELLTDVLNDFRGALVENTIKDLETKTNDLLHTHFDGEIRINLNIEDADKLDVTILKDSNNCTYTQLSKGQRCMLKLCFGLSVMKTIQNHHAISLKQILLDESLDGMDDINKMKAVRMLETIALDYDTIYLVEHSETVKAHIDNSYLVTLNNGNSQIEKI